MIAIHLNSIIINPAPAPAVSYEVAADSFGSLAAARKQRAAHLAATKKALSAYSKAHADAIKNGTARPMWREYEVTR